MKDQQDVLEMVFGNKDTIFKGFNTSIQEEKFLQENNGFVNLCSIGFAYEWSDYVDYNKSKACIKDGKLHIFVHGLPDFLDKSKVEEYFKKTLDHFIKEEYGEFFETLPGCPICMIIESESVEKIV
jgi:hypothetical protein